MKTLNNKNGNLRGVRLNLRLNNENWESHPVQGWVILDSKFNINFMHSEELGVEIDFSRESLLRMIEAIDERNYQNFVGG